MSYSSLTRKKSLRQSYADKLRREGIPQKARKPLKRVSAKRAVENREYSKRRLIFLEKHPQCAVYPHLPATQVHHMNSRVGRKLNDETYWLPVSQAGHDEIHQNTNRARALGFLI